MRTVRKRKEDGASLVEFALIAPLLLLLVLGIVEFGWKFGQFNDVRHATREGARFAAVDGGSTSDIVNQVCNSMDLLAAGVAAVRITILDPTGVDQDPNTAGAQLGTGVFGESASIRVEADVEGLTNAPIISAFIPSTLASDIEFRMEQDPSWSSANDQACP